MFNRLFRRGRGGGGRPGQGGGRGQGGGTKPGSGPGGSCVCTKCGHKVPHTVGQRCMDITPGRKSLG